MLADEEKKIASILAESTGNTENAERSSLTAEVEGIRADLEQKQQQLSETPENISSGDQPNPDYAAIQQRLDAAKAAVQQYQNVGYLGVKLAETSDSSGVQVAEVSPATVAEGILQVGDVITSINAQVITDVASYTANNFTPDQSIEGEITRNGDTVSFSVTLTEHPSYVTANADIPGLESSLANTPQTISSGDQPNPDYSNLKTEIQNLEQRLSAASVKLEEANKADTSITSPELTAAYSRSHEYKIILGDLETNREQKIAQLNEQASNAGPTVNINDLENEIDGQRRQAEEERDRKLKELEDNFGGGQSGKPEGVVALEVQIDAIESDMDALWQERQAYDKEREENSRIINRQIRELEDQIEPLRDQQKDLEMQQRPLRKQEMAGQKERMALEIIGRDLDAKREPLQKQGDEMREKAREEYDEWRSTEEKKVREQGDLVWSDFEKWMKDSEKEHQAKRQEIEEGNEKERQEFEEWSKAQFEEADQAIQSEFRSIEDAFYALDDARYEIDDKRDDLEDKRKDLEDKGKDIEKSLRAERKQQQQELESQKDAIFDEKMRPLEEKAKELDNQIEEKWQQLETLYAKQSDLTQRLEEVQARVRELDKQAEFGLLGVISTALENADELEKSGGMSNFQNFLPQLNNEGEREAPEVVPTAP